MRRTRWSRIGAMLVGVTGAWLLVAVRARACDPPAGAAEAVAAEAASTEAPAAPRAPRAPHAPAAPQPPEPAETPPPAPAPPAPEATLETPGVASMITPRGWFGFGFQCGDCWARTATAESAAVWRFATRPRVYSVDLGGPAARAGLRRGDVIMQIDGFSILSPEGGRRFGAIRPGQTVRWTVQRDGSLRYVMARAAERPGRRERAPQLDLRRELGRLNEMQDLDQLRKELAELNKEIARVRFQDTEPIRVRSQAARPRLRYAGVIGGTEVEVRGPGSIIVDESDDKDELVINTGESVVVIRLPDARKKGEAKPK